MKVLIQNATILSPGSEIHRTVQHILIENGKITSIGDATELKADKIISKENLHVSIGWMDCFANFCDPGEEYKETLESGARAAAAGGFTDVLLIPNTKPVVDNKSQVEYLVQKGKHLPVTIHPMGAVTKKAEGKELSEMYDTQASGAIAWSDGLNPIQSSGILQKALEYLLPIDGTVIQRPNDSSIGTHGLMNEGIVSTRLGLAGSPAIAEEMMVTRDLELAKYTGSRIHLTGLSTRKSLAQVAQAKEDGIRVSCSVTPYHLYFTDADLRDYNTNLKVSPPLRTEADREALREGIRTGVIDFIASHHQPQDYDHKVCEFEYAAYGMETLESVFGAAGAAGISLDTFIQMQTVSVRTLFNLPVPEIKIGEEACLTLFIPDEEYEFTEQHIFSKCRNNAFIGQRLSGKPIGIIRGERLFLSDHSTI